MSTRIRYERGAMISCAHLTSDDGGNGFVFCAIPGGTPQFQIDRASLYASPVINAPTIDTHKAFVAFVNERFGQ